MLEKLLQIASEVLEDKKRKDSMIEGQVIKYVKELDKLEAELADATAEAEMYGDLSDTRHFRTARVNKIKRLIESKEKMIDTLQRHS